MIKKILDFIKNKNNRIILIILIIGTLFMLFPSAPKKQPEKTQPSQEETDDSERLTQILSHIKGAGKVEVMVTYAQTSEKRLAYETKSGKSDRGSAGYEENTDKQAVMSDGEPVVLSKTYPRVKGVVVIAEGAADAKVKTDIQDAVVTAFGIARHKVCVLEK